MRTADGTVYDLRELKADSELKRIAEWGFPIFHFWEAHPKTVLSRVVFNISKYFFV